MPSTPPRRFTLADAMILIAAIAVAIAWARSFAAWEREMAGLGLPPSVRLQFLMSLASPGLAMWGVALLLIRLRQPRPRLRRLLRNPGAVCAAAIVLCLVIHATLALLGLALQFLFITPTPPVVIARGQEVTLAIGMAPAGQFVLTAWLFQFLRGEWRAEPTWIDRSGRLLGLASVIVSVSFWCCVYSQP